MDVEYFRRREAEARRLAAAAETDVIQRVHHDMADLYAAQAERLVDGQPTLMFTEQAAR